MTTPGVAPNSLEVRDLGFTYGQGRFALCGVNFAIVPGEFVGLLGPNGSGKSTLVKLVMRLLAPATGEILVDGRRAAEFRLRDYARRVAYLPQESRPAFAFTVLETVLMGRSPHLGAMGFETDADLAQARAALDRVDAAPFAGLFLDELSGGERQRVMLARALAQEARLLVLDEPASFLDLKHQYELYRLLGDLAHGEGRSCLCVGHDLNVAAAFCDRLVLLRAGRVVAVGRPAEVLTAKTVREVYQIDVDVTVRADGRPVVLPRLESR
jgi:iron complex transport system ATP-binding protein